MNPQSNPQPQGENTSGSIPPKQPTQMMPPNKKSGIGKKILMIILALLVLGGVAYGTYYFTKQQAQKDADAAIAELQQQIEELKTKEELLTKDDSYDSSKLIDYGDGGITVTKESDLVKLTGASSDFKDFVISEINRLNEEKGPECDTAASVTVLKIYDDSVATAGVGACGGATELWAKDDGVWMSVDGTQQLGFKCATLERYYVPDVIAGSKYCFDKNGTDVRRYSDGTVGEIVSSKQLDKELGQEE